jgi:predicted MFS family arabinose efflux permease
MAMVNSGKRWLVLLGLYLAILAAPLSMQSMPPLLSLLVSDLRLTHHEAGLLISLFALSAILLSVPTGMVADRWGLKNVGSIGLALILTGSMLCALSASLRVLMVGRFVSGIGGIAVIVISAPAITRWFADKKIGIAMGVYNTGTPTGVILSFNLISIVAAHAGWRSGMWVTVLFTCLALVVFLLLFSLPPTQTSHGLPRVRAIGAFGAGVWLCAVTWGLVTASIISLISFAPDYIVSMGINLQTAGFLSSVLMGGSLLLSPVVGHMTDRYGNQEALLGGGAIAIAILLLFIPAFGTRLIPIIAAIGCAAAFIPASIYSVAAGVADQNRLSSSFALMAAFSNLGVFIGPQIVGLSRDITGAYRAGFVIMALFALLSAGTAFLLKKKRQQATPLFRPAPPKA